MSSKSNKQTPYFVLDEQHNLLFAPSGRYGASYYVPDSEYRDRIVKRYETIAVLYALPMLFRSLVSLFFQSNREHGYIESAVFFGSIVIAYIFSAFIIRRLTVGLVIARPEPTFSQNCLTLSSSISTLSLWFWQIGATASAALWIWLMGKLHIDDPVGSAILVTLTALSSLIVVACAFLLILKDRPRSASI